MPNQTRQSTIRMTEKQWTALKDAYYATVNEHRLSWNAWLLARMLREAN